MKNRTLVLILVFTDCMFQSGNRLPDDERAGTNSGSTSLPVMYPENTTGTVVIEPEFSFTSSFFHREFAMVKSGSKDRVINRQGEIVSPKDYEDIGVSFQYGVAPVKINGKFALMKPTAKGALLFRYDPIS